MTVLFTPLRPLEAGKKRRANAKPPVITKLEYFHEEVPLRDFLTKILMSVKREDLFESSWLFRVRNLDRNDCFTLSYTIPRRVTDQIIISNLRDYSEMVDQATSKSPHEVKVYVIENQVCPFALVRFFILIAPWRLGKMILTIQKVNMKKRWLLERKRRYGDSLRIYSLPMSMNCFRPTHHQRKRLPKQKSSRNLNADTAARTSSAERHLAM